MNVGGCLRRNRLRLLLCIAPALALAVCLPALGAENGSGTSSAGVTFRDKVFGKTYRFEPDQERVMVRFEPGAGARDASRIAARLGLSPERAFDSKLRFAVFQLPAGASAERTLDALRTDTSVRRAYPAMTDAEGYSRYFLPDEITVRFESHVADRDARRMIADLGCTIVRAQRTPGYFTLGIAADVDPFEILARFRTLDEIRFCEPSYVSFDDLLDAPDDSLYDFMWNLRNEGQFGGTAGADIGVEHAWEITRGSASVVIALIDTGVDLAHPDLVAGLLPRGDEDWDFADPDDPSPDDEHNHGTACAGIIAAQHNGIGVSGIAPDCRLMPLRVDLTSGQNQNRADAIAYAASRRDEFDGLVLSLSWRMSAGDTIAVHDAIADAARRGCIVFAAAGNGGTERIDYPAAYPETIAVGATSPCDERKSFESCDGEHWWGSDWGDELDLVAPGVFITTTDRVGDEGYTPSDYTHAFSGTSAACPMAAAVAALVLSVEPRLALMDVRRILERSSIDGVGDPREDTPGWDPWMGWGRLDAFGAIEAAIEPAPHLRVGTTWIDDSRLGNGNGAAEPGETVEMHATLVNDGLADASAVRARWISRQPDVAGVRVARVSYGSIATGETGAPLGTAVVTIAADATCGASIPFTLEIAAGEGAYGDGVEIAMGTATRWRVDDLESGDTGWQHDASAGEDTWALALTDLARSPEHAWRATTADDIADVRLWLDPFRVPPGAALRFWHTFRLDAGYDGAVLEISTDGGATFDDLGPHIDAGRYTGIVSTQRGSPLAGRVAWTGGELERMTRVDVDLTSFADEEAILRWRLASDRLFDGGEWQIDDLVLWRSRCEPLEPAIGVRVDSDDDEVGPGDRLALRVTFENRTDAEVSFVSRLAFHAPYARTHDRSTGVEYTLAPGESVEEERSFRVRRSISEPLRGLAVYAFAIAESPQTGTELGAGFDAFLIGESTDTSR